MSFAIPIIKRPQMFVYMSLKAAKIYEEDLPNFPPMEIFLSNHLSRIQKSMNSTNK